jgi:hypothetical protein
MEELTELIQLLWKNNDLSNTAYSKLLNFTNTHDSIQLMQTAVVGQSEQCCEPITDGFFLGTMCPKCNKPFRKNFK